MKARKKTGKAIKNRRGVFMHTGGVFARGLIVYVSPGMIGRTPSKTVGNSLNRSSTVTLSSDRREAATL